MAFYAAPTFWPPAAGGRGRSHQGKLLVVVAVEIEKPSQGKAAARPYPPRANSDFSANTLHVFMSVNIVPGSSVKTDGLAYLGAPGVTHEPHTIGSMAPDRTHRQGSRSIGPIMGARLVASLAKAYPSGSGTAQMW